MKFIRSGFARRGSKTRGSEIYSQHELELMYKRDGGRPALRSKRIRDLFVYGSTATTTRAWGFPGTTLNGGRIRDQSPETWDVFPWHDTADREKLTNSGEMLTIDKTTGEVTREHRYQKVLQQTVAQTLFIQRGRGVKKRFSFPKTIIDDFDWLMPSRYQRSEGYIALTPGTATFRGDNSRRRWTLTVRGHSSYITLDSMADRSELRKHWKSSGHVNKFHLMQQARARALNKIRKNDIELSVALAESRKTITHLAKTAMDVFKIYRAIKRGKFSEVWRILGFNPSHRNYPAAKKLFYATKEPAKRWLELQYAWYPLVGDINGAVKTLMKESRQQMTFRVTGNASEDFNYQVNHLPNSPGAHEIHVAAGRSSAKCIVHYAVTDPALVLAAEWGINPLSAVWEVVPWSFVVDWFTSIGDFLTTIDVGIGKEFISGTETYLTTINRESRLPIQRISFPVSPLNPMGGHSAATSHFMSMDRMPISKFPTVGAYIKNPLSTTHVLNAIALARSIKK